MIFVSLLLEASRRKLVVVSMISSFSSLPGEMIQFDELIFFKWVG